MITTNEFNRILTYVKRNYGIDLSDKQVLVTGRLENYLIKNGYDSYDAYMEIVEKNPHGSEEFN